MADVRTTTILDAQTAPEAPPSPAHLAIRREDYRPPDWLVPEIRLEFDLDTPEGRENSLHKLDTLEIAIRVFRDAFVAEFEPYDRRERILESLRE